MNSIWCEEEKTIFLRTIQLKWIEIYTHTHILNSLLVFTFQTHLPFHINWIFLIFFFYYFVDSPLKRKKRKTKRLLQRVRCILTRGARDFRPRVQYTMQQSLQSRERIADEVKIVGAFQSFHCCSCFFFFFFFFYFKDFMCKTKEK